MCRAKNHSDNNRFETCLHAVLKRLSYAYRSGSLDAQDTLFS